MRAPLVVVSGSRDAERVGELVSTMMSAAGYAVGLTTKQRNMINGQAMHRSDLPGRSRSQLVLRNPDVDFAVVQVDAEEIDEQGLSFDYCDVVVITRADEPELRGPRSVETVLLGLAGEHGCAVIDAADPQIEDLLRRATGRTILFSADPEHPSIAARLADGGEAIVVGREGITYVSGDQTLTLMPEESLREATPGLALESGLAAIAAAIAVEAPIETIRAALGSEGIAGSGS